MDQIWDMVGNSRFCTSDRHISLRLTTSGYQVEITVCASGMDWPFR